MPPDLLARGEQVIVEGAGNADLGDPLLDQMRAPRRVREDDQALTARFEPRQAIEHAGKRRLPVVQDAPEVEDQPVVAVGDLFQAGKKMYLGQVGPSAREWHVGADRLGDTVKTVAREGAREAPL